MRKIKLTQGKFALVDDCDYEYLNQWKWCVHKCGNTLYATRGYRINGRNILLRMHQVIAKRMGFNNTADHVNRDGLDNRRQNLRNATQKQQNENQNKQKNNTSGYKGVCWNKSASKWQAYITHHGAYVYLGVFDCVEDAIAARQAAEQLYFTHGGVK